MAGQVPSEQADQKTTILYGIDFLKLKFDEQSQEFSDLDNLAFSVEQGHVTPMRITIHDISLTILARDSFDAALIKISTFLTQLKPLLATTFAPPSIGPIPQHEADMVHGAVKGVAEPLVPAKGHTEWRDVNAEIVALSQAFKGTPDELALRNIREASHKRELGKSDINFQICGKYIRIAKGDSDDIVLTKLSRFIGEVKAEHTDLFPPKPAQPEQVSASADAIFWRDVIAGIDGLFRDYPDKDFQSLYTLRTMIENGEVGVGMHLLMTINNVHLWIQKKDDGATIKDKIAVFIGELKQIASSNKKTKEAPLDPKLEQTYWRDIEAALSALEPAFGDDANFKLLHISVKKGILGTVRNFHAVIGGEALDIIQSDSDTDIKDKLSAFIRKLSAGGQVKLNEEVRKKFHELEKKYTNLEHQNLDLESRYKKAGGDLQQRGAEIIRLEDQVRKLQAELRRAQTAPPAPPPSQSTYRSYSG